MAGRRNQPNHLNDELADDNNFLLETSHFSAAARSRLLQFFNSRSSLSRPPSTSAFPPIPPRRVTQRRPNDHAHTRRERGERGGNASNPPNPPNPSNPSNSSTSSNPPVIDLTEEPDSPPVPLRNAARPGHPRRSEHQQASPPRLSRSDSTVVGGSGSGAGGGRDASIIDLTADSSPLSARRPSSSRPTNPDTLFARAQRPHTHTHTHTHTRPTHQASLIEFQTLAQDSSFLARSLSDFLSRDILRRLPHGIPSGLGVGIHLEPEPPSPKPSLEPIPPAAEGFTRDTRGAPEEEIVVVCPRCNEELAYDPDETSAPAGSKKRKRSSGEHHFWALKKCGHVYCAECFENRRPSGKGSSSSSGSRDIYCSVDGCDTKAFSKSEWVGIYL